MRNRFLLFCLLLIGIALLAVATVSALEPMRVTQSLDIEDQVQISDKYIVWDDYRHGDAEIYAYNVVTRSETRVSNNGGDDSEPKVWGDKVVWIRDWSELWYYNLSSKALTEVYNDWDEVVGHDVWDRYVIYANRSWGMYPIINVYKYDTISMTTTLLWSKSESDISLRYIDVWKEKLLIGYSVDWSNSYAVHYNLNTDAQQVISFPSHTEFCRLGAIDGNKIACSSWGGNFIFDVPGQTFKPLLLNAIQFEFGEFGIHGNTIIFVNLSDEALAFDINTYDLMTGNTARITYTPSIENNLAIWGDKIAYLENRDGMMDIYYLVLPQNPPDLVVTTSDIEVNPVHPVSGAPSRVIVHVHNTGKSSAEGTVFVYIPSGPKDQTVLQVRTPTIMAGQTEKVIFQDVAFKGVGYVELEAEVIQLMSQTYEQEVNLGNNRASVIILVNDLPIPNIEVSTLSTTTYKPLTFMGDPSFDKDGISIFLWDFGDGTSAIGSSVEHEWTDDGDYTVVLTVYDTLGAYNSTSITVTVDNQAPAADGEVPDIVARNVDIVLSAIGAFDPDGTIVEYEWSIGDEVLYGILVTYAFTMEDEVVTVVLNVTDDDGAEDQMTFNVELVESSMKNIPPVAVINVNGAGGNLTFTGKASYDPNGEIRTYSWTFSDGGSDTGDTVMHYFEEGTHFITLHITDDEGLEASAVVAVTINYTEPPTIVQKVYGNTTVVNEVRGNQAPSVTASFTVVDEKTGNVQFKGSGSDPDGTIVKYEWDFDGDGEWDHSSTSTGDIGHNYQKPGFYLAIFRVTDDNSTSAYIVLSVGIRTDEIGGNLSKPHTSEDSQAADMGLVAILLVIAIVVAIVVAVLAARVSSKKFVHQEKDIMADQEAEELKRLVEEGKATGANLDEAEALIREFEGR